MKTDFGTIDGIATVDDALKKNEIPENRRPGCQQTPRR